MNPYIEKVKRDLPKVKQWIDSLEKKGIDMKQVKKVYSIITRLIEIYEKQQGEK